MSIVYLNGEYLPVEQAKVSVMDRGFLFGDGVYEVIPAYGNRLLRLKAHLQRLQNSLDAVRIPNPLNAQQWQDVLHHILDINESEDKSVYVHVSRGTAPKRDHAFPARPRPTVFVMASPLQPVAKAELKQGVAAITLDDIRWRACNIKATALLANAMLRQQAVEQGAAEAILIRDGYATEGAASNVFMVSNHILITPPNGPSLLPGITRDLVLELALGQGIPCEERAISETELKHADEIWLTSSTREILPVISLDKLPVGAGCAGPLWDRMIDIFQDYKARLRRGDISDD